MNLRDRNYVEDGNYCATTSSCISLCACAMVILNERCSFVYNVVNTGVGCMYKLFHHFSKTVLSLQDI
jgi:hypothetical protein